MGWLRGVCGLAGQSVRLEDVPARGLVGSVAALHRDRAEMHGAGAMAGTSWYCLQLAFACGEDGV